MNNVRKYIKRISDKTDGLVRLSDLIKKSDDVAVTVHCFVYNQEKYISKCIDSMLEQLVNFNVEIIVHDDCSTDNSKKTIQDYVKKYPDVIKAIYEEKNIYSKTGNFLEIAEIVNNESQGKYIAICEGDDYWVDPLKLYLQVTVLEKFENCHFCVHRVAVLSSNEKYCPTEKTIPSFKLKTGFIKDKKFINFVHDKYNFQTSSYFFRKKDYETLFFTKPLYMKLMPTDDEVLLRHFGTMGETCFIDRTMSTYLQYTDGSWSKEHKDNKDSSKKKRFIEALKAFDNYTNYKYHKSCHNFIMKIQLFSKMESREYSSILKNRELRKILRKIDYKTYLSLKIKYFLGKID